VNIAVVNAGSSSLKLRLLDAANAPVRGAVIERWSGEDETEALSSFFAGGAGVDAVAHRVVHGGPRFDGPVLLDAAAVAELDALTELAPIHQPRALAGIRAATALVGKDVPQVACFDTAFHHAMPAAASTYALPRSWRERWPIRRYGFHGLSHAYASRQGAAQVGLDLDQSRIVTCHLGAGASLCAVLNGRSVDTTMGFTPLEGLVMATRSGSVDPGLVLWLIQQQGLDPAEVQRALDEESGLKGLAGSGDMRDVLASGPGLAVDVYLHRLAGSIAQMAAALGGVDLLAFTGGVGEHAAPIRDGAVARLEFLGPFKTVVIEAREDLEMAGQTRALLDGTVSR
jgi:acetate kinase